MYYLPIRIHNGGRRVRYLCIHIVSYSIIIIGYLHNAHNIGKLEITKAFHADSGNGSETSICSSTI